LWAQRSAVRLALKDLRTDRILAIAPEETRCGDGRLQKGRTGVAMLALASGAPVLPVAYYGGERFQQNIFRLRRTDFHIVVGEPFHIQRPEGGSSRLVREKITSEIMNRLATLIPVQYRGYYPTGTLLRSNTFFRPHNSDGWPQNSRTSPKRKRVGGIDYRKYFIANETNTNGKLLFRYS
jgi:1-acyl-sn-glycerol-3-phosphate acyltransferase